MLLNDGTPLDAVADTRLGQHAPWSGRIAAAALALETVSSERVEIVAVRAAVFSRAAIQQLGGAIHPSTPGEVTHLREQVGHGMTLLGFADEPHAILRVGDVLIELADGGSRGPLLRPFVVAAPSTFDRWVAYLDSTYTTIAYECIAAAPVSLAATATAHDLASAAVDALRAQDERRAA